MNVVSFLFVCIFAAALLFIQGRYFCYAEHGKLQKAFAANVFCTASPAILMGLASNLYYRITDHFSPYLYYALLFGIALVTSCILIRSAIYIKRDKKISYAANIFYFFTHIGIAAIYGFAEFIFSYFVFYATQNLCLYIASEKQMVFTLGMTVLALVIFVSISFLFSPSAGIKDVPAIKLQKLPKRAYKYRKS